MRVRLTPPATRDLSAILVRIAKESPRSAAKVAARLDEVMQHLAEHPRLGRPTRRHGIRCTNAVPYPYLIFYRTVSAEIQVIAIRHGARNPNTMPARPR